MSRFSSGTSVSTRIFQPRRRRLAQGRPAQVVVLAARGAIGNGDDAGFDLHYFFVFDTRTMSVMRMVLSSALHMS
jgi:hypothetical protein